ncbi:MAG: hypothetical protein JWP91_4026 [Fibrobacteres bacterium]|nr:hypothetical protein [Fibrobacterota bacterium]
MRFRSARSAVLSASLSALFLASLLGPGTASAVPQPAAGNVPLLMAAPKQVLIFDKFNGVGHAATDTCVSILKATLLAHGMTAESTKDSLAFTPANLARFGAVVFINTNYRNGAVLGREQEAAFEGYIHAGGGFVAIHNASPLTGSPEIDAVWPWFVGMYGTRFIGHGNPQTGTVVLEDTAHASTRGLPTRFTVKDEWYLLRDDPRSVAGIRVLARVDASTLASGGKDRVVSWYRPFEGGRVWMTTLGHDLGTFGDADFLAHLRGGIAYAGGWDGATAVRQSGQATKRDPFTASDGPGQWRDGAANPYFRAPGDALWRNLMGRIAR